MRLPRALLLVPCVIALATAAGGCGDGAEEQEADPPLIQGPAPTTDAPPVGDDEITAEPAEKGSRPAEKPPRGDAGPAEGPRHDPRVTELEREAAATARD